MKKITMVLTILMVGLLSAGCGTPPAIQAELDQLRGEKATWQQDQAELAELRAEQESWQEDREELAALQAQQESWQQKEKEQTAKIGELEDEIDKNVGQIRERDEKIDEKNSQLTAAAKEKAELENQIMALEQMIEGSLPIHEEVVATLSTQEILQTIRRYYPSAVVSLAGTKYELVSLETMNDFLAADTSDSAPGPREIQQDLLDHLTFRLKERWAKAGLPYGSLGLLKGTRTLPSGRSGVQWRPIFITKENGELVVYEIIPKYDEVVKIEKPDSDTYLILFATYTPI